MKIPLIKNPVILMILFLLLQIGGQIAAGFAGKAGNPINFYTVLSYIAMILRGVVWVLVLKLIPLTTAYPFTGAVYLLILPLSMLIFSEHPGWSRFAGSSLIFIGIVFTTAGAANNDQ